MVLVAMAAEAQHNPGEAHDGLSGTDTYQAQAHATLAAHDMRIEPDGLYVKHHSPVIADIMKGTDWDNGAWQGMLKRLKGAQARKNVVRFPSGVGRVTVIPLERLPKPDWERARAKAKDTGNGQANDGQAARAPGSLDIDDLDKRCGHSQQDEAGNHKQALDVFKQILETAGHDDEKRGRVLLWEEWRLACRAAKLGGEDPLLARQVFDRAVKALTAPDGPLARTSTPREGALVRIPVSHIVAEKAGRAAGVTRNTSRLTARPNATPETAYRSAIDACRSGRRLLRSAGAAAPAH